MMIRTALGFVGVCSFLAVATAFAGPGDGKRGAGFGRMEGVERTVTATETGVVIEISSDDPALVEKIQARHAEQAARESMRETVEHVVTNIDDGVVVEITSDDPEVVAHLQDRFAEKQDRVRGAGEGRGRFGKGKGKGQGRMRGKRGPGPRHPIEGAEHAITNTDTGVRVEISSEDPAVVEQIQARFLDGDQKGKDAGEGKRRGRRGAGSREGRRGGHRGFGHGGDPRGFGAMRPIEGTERTVTNLENGVQLTVTADDPELVAAIQERFAKMAERAAPKKDAEPVAEEPAAKESDI